MPNEKILISTKISPSLKIIKASSSFGQTLTKIFKLRNPDYLVIQKPTINQMSAVILSRILGKKFIWIQNFQNPPTPNFFGKILIAQADKIITKSKKDSNKLKSWGIPKTKIHYQR